MDRDKIQYIIDKIKADKKILKIGCAAIVVIVAFCFFGLNGEDDTISVETEQKQGEEQSAKAENEKETQDNSSTSEEENAPFYVDISGEIKKPGVYSMKSGSRIFEAIEKAGGLTAAADISGINRAEVISDGMKIVIPKEGEQQDYEENGTANLSESSVTESNNVLININTADLTKLQDINGVGPATAQKIIDYRENNGNFTSKEDIKNVSGIGDKTYEKMKDQITV